ncbi:MAG: hypothetical protein M3Y35_14165 [Actinomycetota bacterium]|nr:hypothetical protein [Actinomycetota bacterium]
MDAAATSLTANHVPPSALLAVYVVRAVTTKIVTVPEAEPGPDTGST